MDYQRKYLKYKAKYLAYKQALELEAMQSGGGEKAAGPVHLFYYGLTGVYQTSIDMPNFEAIQKVVSENATYNSKWYICEKVVIVNRGYAYNSYDLSKTGSYFEFNKDNYEAMNVTNPLYIASLEFIQAYDEKDFELKKRGDHPKVEQAKEEKRKQEEIAQAAIREKAQKIAAQITGAPAQRQMPALQIPLSISAPKPPPAPPKNINDVLANHGLFVTTIFTVGQKSGPALGQFMSVYKMLQRTQQKNNYLNESEWKAFSEKLNNVVKNIDNRINFETVDVGKIDTPIDAKQRDEMKKVFDEFYGKAFADLTPDVQQASKDRYEAAISKMHADY